MKRRTIPGPFFLKHGELRSVGPWQTRNQEERGSSGLNEPARPTAVRPVSVTVLPVLGLATARVLVPFPPGLSRRAERLCQVVFRISVACFPSKRESLLPLQPLFAGRRAVTVHAVIPTPGPGGSCLPIKPGRLARVRRGLAGPLSLLNRSNFRSFTPSLCPHRAHPTRRGRRRRLAGRGGRVRLTLSHTSQVPSHNTRYHRGGRTFV